MSSAIGSSIWKEAPRHCAGLRLPPYRYLPGRNTHPDDGHLPVLGDRAFFYGLDLYHAGFFYEAHEAWESVWLKLPKTDLRRMLYMGLIQNSAAMLKLTLGQYDPARALSRRAYHYIDLVAQQDAQCLGIQLPQLLKEMQRFYQPLWQGQAMVAPQAIAPRVKLN